MLLSGARAASKSTRRLDPRTVRRSSSVTSNASSQEEVGPEPMSSDHLRAQLELDSSADLLRRIFYGSRGLQRSRTINQRIQTNQDKAIDYDETVYTQSRFKRLRPMADDAQAALTVSMDLLRFQLKACVAPNDFIRVFATAIRHQKIAQLLGDRNLQRLVWIKLQNNADTPGVLSTLNVLVSHLASQRIPLDSGLLWLGLKSSARCLALPAMKRYLRYWGKIPMSSQQSVDLLAALKEGVEKHSATSVFPSRQATMELMYGFPDGRNEFNLRRCIRRHSTRTRALWMSILATYGAKDQMWMEWLDFCADVETIRKAKDGFGLSIRDWGLYLGVDGLVATPTEKSARSSAPSDCGGSSAVTVTGSTPTKTTPDDMITSAQTAMARLTILEFARINEPKLAWQVFTTIPEAIAERDNEVWDILFAYADHMPRVDQPTGQRILGHFCAKLTKMLREIEEELGVQWVTFKRGDPYHRLSGRGRYGSALAEHASALPGSMRRARVTLMPASPRRMVVGAGRKLPAAASRARGLFEEND